jgi:ketosteroid isomerase-like protein
MGASENKELIRSIFASKNPSAFVDAMADDVKFTLTGTTKFSGTFNGKQELAAKLFGPLFAALDANGIALTPDNLIADGEFVVMQARGKATAKNGLPYNNNYCHVFRVTHGKIREITEYLDTELVTKVFGK